MGKRAKIVELAQQRDSVLESRQQVVQALRWLAEKYIDDTGTDKNVFSVMDEAYEAAGCEW